MLPLGKPKNGPEDKFSLAPVAKRLAELLPGVNVVFAKDDAVTGDVAKECVSKMNDGDIVLLENTRFRGNDETKNAKASPRSLLIW